MGCGGADADTAPAPAEHVRATCATLYDLAATARFRAMPHLRGISGRAVMAKATAEPPVSTPVRPDTRRTRLRAALSGNGVPVVRPHWGDDRNDVSADSADLNGGPCQPDRRR